MPKVGVVVLGQAKGLPLPGEGASLVRQLGDGVGDVSLGDMMKGCLQEDSPEHPLARVARIWQRKTGKVRLRLLEEVVPSSPPEVGECMTGWVGDG